MEAVTPEVSASKLIGVFDKVVPEDTGKFYSYDGSEVSF